MTTEAKRPVRIANCSGFFGDRLSAAKEMVADGPIDVLTGDWLAELTMLILARQRMKNGEGSGWARTFLLQLEQVLGTCLDRGIKIVVNAGGLDPAGAAAAVGDKAAELGLAHVRIAYVTGDDLMPRLAELGEAGETLINLDTGEELASLGLAPLTANVYLGARGITEALCAGADVVITGRVTDAALAIGPAAWWHGWSYDDANAGNQATLDSLAGALVAGHVIECGAQATGGNYSSFLDVPGLEHPGFPLAEVGADGTSVITKHDGTGGMVTIGTVTAQMLYELGGPEYLNPDVSARFDSMQLDQVGCNRVRISKVHGIRAPARLKVAINTLGGFRNAMSLVITGMDVEAKADLALRTITGLSLAQCEAHGQTPQQLGAASKLGVGELEVQLLRTGTPNPTTLVDAQSQLRIIAKDRDPKKVGRLLTSKVIESVLSSYPGMFATAPPGDATPYGVYWPSTIAADLVQQSVILDGETIATLSGGGAQVQVQVQVPVPVSQSGTLGVDYDANVPHYGRGVSANGGGFGESLGVREPLGVLVDARSGDKGGSANVGFWVRSPTEDEAVALARGAQGAGIAPSSYAPVDITSPNAVTKMWEQDEPLTTSPEAVADATARYHWLQRWLTPDRVLELLPEASGCDIEIHRFPNLLGVNVVIKGLLGRGVAETNRLDPQAKGLGEQIRACIVDLPGDLIDGSRC